MTREIPLVAGEYYHVFNRGSAKFPTFLTDGDYKQAQLSIAYYQNEKVPVKYSRFKSLPESKKLEILQNQLAANKKLVEIISYVLMPNHFHLILKEITDGGISKFVGQFTNSYTRYFNTKNSRPGSLFQGTFKAVHIETENQLIHLSRYIHLNPYVSSMLKIEDLPYYYWSSYPDFLKGHSATINLQPILSYFKSPADYQSFVVNHSDYARQLEIIKHQLLDID